MLFSQINFLFGKLLLEVKIKSFTKSTTCKLFLVTLQHI
jgi:hypothetical protein